LTDEYVKSGLLSPQAAANIKSPNSKFTPLDRLEYLEQNVPPEFAEPRMPGKQARTYHSTELKGSDKEIGDPLAAFTRVYESRRHQLEQHEVVKAYTDMVDARGNQGASGIGRRMDPGDSLGPGEGKLTKFENGKPVEYAVPEDIVEVYRLFKDHGEQGPAGKFVEALRVMGAAYTGMVTKNPVFVTLNPVRDYQSIKMNAPFEYGMKDVLHGARIQATSQFLDPVLEFTARMTGTTYNKTAARKIVERAREEGALGGGLHSYGRGPVEHTKWSAPEAPFLSAEGQRLFQERFKDAPFKMTGEIIKGGVRFTLVDWWNKPFGELAELSENINRVGLFEKMNKINDPRTGTAFTPQERAYQTHTLPTNFAMRGSSGAWDTIFKIVPFFRARSLGITTGFGHMENKAANDPEKFALAMAFATVPTIAVNAWNNAMYPEVAKKISKDFRGNRIILIYGNGTDEDGNFNQVIGLPKEGIVKAASNAIESFMDAERDKGKLDYRKVLQQFTAEAVLPFDAMSGGQFQAGRALTSMFPPIVNAAANVSANKNMRTGVTIYSGDPNVKFDSAYDVGTTLKRQDTPVLPRLVSAGLAKTVVDPNTTYDSLGGKLLSPKGLEEWAIKGTIGQTGRGLISLADPILGPVLEKLTGDKNWEHSMSGAAKTAARVVDPSYSVFKAYKDEASGDQTMKVKAAASMAATEKHEIDLAAREVITEGISKDANQTPEQKSEKLRNALVTTLKRYEGKLAPEDMELFYTTLDNKLKAKVLDFDTVDYMLSSMDNRGKAYFIKSLLDDPAYRRGGEKTQDLMDRLAKMQANGKLGPGVGEEFVKIVGKEQKQKGAQ
jgi:hypothetical protein